jgi:hypothetical protein
LIDIVTLGWGHDLALWVAIKLGYEDCGCEKRRIYLNHIVGCKEKQIEL